MSEDIAKNVKKGQGRKFMYNMSPYLETIDRVIQQGPFRDDWLSLAAYRVPQWYRELKFGIFIHWGVFSVPAFCTEWYPRGMYIEGSAEYEHHRAVYGSQKEFGYKDFVPMFKAEHFDPDAWLSLFEAAGAQYVIPVAEHHDGFQMYKSEISKWNAADMGPRRDVLGELFQAARARGMTAGASSHRIEHWFFLGNGRKFDSDIRGEFERGDLYWPSMPEADHFDRFSEPVPTEEFLQDWLVRTCELIDRYRPRILYFDWWIQHFSAGPYLRKAAAYYYNRAAEWGTDGVVINYKHDAFPFGTAVPDVERGQFAAAQPFVWQSDTAIALNSWCYTENNTFRPAGALIQVLADVVSKNGRLLLNVGPKADGTICEEERKVLEEIGAWMDINKEAIYGSCPWKIWGEGEANVSDKKFSEGKDPGYSCCDFRFTAAGGRIYAIALKCSEEGRYCVRSLGKARDVNENRSFQGIIKCVRVLGYAEEPVWKQTEEGLVIETGFRSDKPVVFRVEAE